MSHFPSNDIIASGNITTQNLVPAGVATAGSAVEIVTDGRSGIIIQVTGTYTGALSLQITVDGTNWITIGGVPLANVNTGVNSATIASATVGIFQAEITGAAKARITGLAAMTGTAAVTIRAALGVALVGLDAPIPVGTNSIGNLGTVTTVTTVTTVSTVTAVTNLNGGQTAHSSASTGNPVRVGGRVLPATPDLTLAAGDASDMGITTGQQLLGKAYAPAEWDYVFNGTIVNSTTAVVFKAAAGASIRNYVTGLTIASDTLGTATELVIKDGAVTASSVAANVITSGTHDLKIGDQIVFSSIGSFTGIVAGTPYWVLTVPSTTTFTISATPNGSTFTVGGTGSPIFNRIMFRSKLQTAALPYVTIPFRTPLRGAPNSTMDIQTVTASTGNVYYTVQGYIGF